MGQLFQQTIGDLKTTEGAVEERKEAWKMTEEKMEIYSNLKENLKKIMSFTNSGLRKM